MNKAGDKALYKPGIVYLSSLVKEKQKIKKVYPYFNRRSLWRHGQTFFYKSRCKRRRRT